ncbi:MAG: PD-(D/E)XK nuclease family protein, partial [Hyphomicrobiales bacterium]
PLAPWSEAERALLRELTDEVCDRAHEAGLSGKPLLWDVERRRLARDLELFLESELDARAESGYAFAAAELAFGTSGADAYPPVLVELDDGRSVAFRGRVDRVDAAPGPRLAVYDYKSGSAAGYRKLAQTTVDEGLHLQLPIYALAARVALGSPEAPVEAHYWFVDEREDFKRYGYAYTPEHDARFRDAIGHLLDGIGGGVFPANPGDNREKGYGNCNFCAYRDLCQSERARQWEKKQMSPEAAPYLALHGQETPDA